ncbi:hypothetical protein ACFP1Z_22170 [Streptomyces gamaensis]|uniref:Uncharacterized protein n=1 Tax=Streptomyces gamaensis TaxID=1763542 RepID=A0ABW0Z2B2_9ACTN
MPGTVERSRPAVKGSRGKSPWTATPPPGCAPSPRSGSPTACREALTAAGPLDEDDAAALRALGIGLDAVRARTESAFGPGSLDARRRRNRAAGAAAAVRAALPADLSEAA